MDLASRRPGAGTTTSGSSTPRGGYPAPPSRNSTSATGGPQRQPHQQSQSNHHDPEPSQPPLELQSYISHKSGHHEQVKQLQNQVSTLTEENEMLREIEMQFWALLTEREDLQQELTDIRKTGGADATVKSAAVAANRGGTAEETAKLREENDDLHAALEECMELIMLKDQGKDITRERGGPVASFLSWLHLESDRKSVRHTLQEVDQHRGGDDAAFSSPLDRQHQKGEAHLKSALKSSPNSGGGSGGGGFSETERNALIQELSISRREIRELKDELDRTDMSRLQALDDAHRLEQQIEVLSKNVSDLRAAYAQVKARADRGSGDAEEVVQLRSLLANQTSEIGNLKVELAQAKQLQSVGAASLAADAARIRSELAQRDRERSSSMGRATSESPAPVQQQQHHAPSGPHPTR